MNLPYGYTNTTGLDRGIVSKTYTGADAEQRFRTELAMVQCLQGQAFMPEVVGQDETGLMLRTRYVPNRHAQDLLWENPHLIPYTLGQLARDLQAIPVARCAQLPAAPGDVLVHSDFGPQNLLFSQESLSMFYLVDWEWSHAGHSYEDIAWAEWIIRIHYHADRQMITALYGGFGVMPAWEERHGLMLAKCGHILDYAKRDGNEAAVTMWQERITLTETFTH